MDCVFIFFINNLTESVDVMRTLCGLHADSMRTPCGLRADSVRTPYGHTESARSPQGQVGDCKVQ
jgi:hypothetical protein